MVQQYQHTEFQQVTSDSSKSGATDTVVFGQSTTLTTQESISIVVERSMDKLRAVVDDAKAQLGIEEGDSPLDVSPEATANRIADFALNFFDKWRANHDGLSDDDARQQYADFIGGAIFQGVDEARGILGALNALNSDVEDHIGSITDYIQQRLDDFVNPGS